MKSLDLHAVFNRGRISRLALARGDVDRVSLSAEAQTNWMPRVLGSMMLRPGLEHHGSVAGEGVKVPFVFDVDDTAFLELSAGALRIWNFGDTLLSRPVVGTIINNSLFEADLSGWSIADEGSAATTWSGGMAQLFGTGTDAARLRQAVSVPLADQATQHALRIVVARGPLLIRIGSTAGDDDIFRQAVLRTGTHSIAFTPGVSTFHVEFSSPLSYPVLVDSCRVELSGIVSIPTPWSTAEICRSVRWQRSRDVLFCAAEGFRQQRIERRPNDSWSVVEYLSNDGPFQTENTSSLTLAASAISGAVTLTASSDLFKTTHVGALFRLTSQGQIVQAGASGDNTFTDSIRVTGVGATRAFSITITGTWSGTISLQRSLSAPGSWATVATYSTNQSSVSFNDGLDNSEAFYRIGFEATNHTSGTATMVLESENGSITGAVRVTGFTSSTQVSAVVVDLLGGTDPTDIWAEGAWSDEAGWPSAVTIADGRLVWSGLGRNWMSVSDAFDSFDPDFEGDAGPINREVGTGATDRTNWLLPLQRLIAGTGDAEHSVRSTSFEEPVTPGNYGSRVVGTKGSARAPAVVADARGYFIGRNANALYELDYDAQRIDVLPQRVTTLVPEIGNPGFTRIAAQVEPDVRIHCVRSDGTVAIMVRDPAEDVIAWIDLVTDGFVEDVAVLPGAVDDRVFYTVRRTINGMDVRYHEEIAPEGDCRGGAVNKQADSFVTGAGSTQVIAGLGHLEAKSVVVWADGRDLGSFTVVGGQIDVGEVVTQWVVGLPYTAQYKSAKMAVQSQVGSLLGQRARIGGIGLVLADSHAQGLEYGPDFTTMDSLPLVEFGEDVPPDRIWDAYDGGMIEFPGDWSPDSRMCLRAQAPRPCTVLGAVIAIDRQNALSTV